MGDGECPRLPSLSIPLPELPESLWIKNICGSTVLGAAGSWCGELGGVLILKIWLWLLLGPAKVGGTNELSPEKPQRKRGTVRARSLDLSGVIDRSHPRVPGSRDLLLPEVALGVLGMTSVKTGVTGISVPSSNSKLSVKKLGVAGKATGGGI